MLKLAGKLLIVAGVLLLLAFIFQMPLLFDAFSHPQNTFYAQPLRYIVYPVILLAAAIIFIIGGRKLK